MSAHSQPFMRARMMRAQIEAVVQAYGAGTVGAQAALANLGPYEGRGKGRTARHDRGGNRAHQRAALKARNRARHRRAGRG